MNQGQFERLRWVELGAAFAQLPSNKRLGAPMRAAMLLSFLALSTAVMGCSGGSEQEIATLDSSDYPQGKADSIANRQVVLYDGGGGLWLRLDTGVLNDMNVSNEGTVSVVGKTSDRIFLSTNPTMFETCYAHCSTDGDWLSATAVKAHVEGVNPGVEMGQLIALGVRHVDLDTGTNVLTQYGNLACTYTNSDGSAHRRRVFSDEVLVDFNAGTVTDLGWDGRTFQFSDCSGIDPEAAGPNVGGMVDSIPVPVNDPAGLGGGKPYSYRVYFQAL